jgi:putative transposase
MARRPRLAVAGELHQLLLRCHSGQAAFADDADRNAFVSLLREPAAQQGVAVHAYALLDNEVHLLATPAEADALGRLMQSIGRRYVAYYNRRHGQRGTLWDGRFRNSLLDSRTWLLPATLHIEALPVRSELVDAAQDWDWSSAAHHTGRRRDLLITDHALYWQFGNTPFDRERAHTIALDEVQQETEDVRLSQAVERGLLLGPPAFIERMAALVGRSLTPRPRGRPPRPLNNKTVPN